MFLTFRELGADIQSNLERKSFSSLKKCVLVRLEEGQTLCDMENKFLPLDYTHLTHLELQELGKHIYFCRFIIY